MRVEYLKSILDYNSYTGTFVWKVYKSSRAVIGSIAGTFNPDGYLIIKIDGKNYRSHHLAWLYTHGIWPSDILDHINGERADNRIINLREATIQLNAQNQRNPVITNKCGLIGVRFRKDAGKFTAQIKLNGKTKHIGYFTDKNDAHAAYILAKRELHEFCTI